MPTIIVLIITFILGGAIGWSVNEFSGSKTGTLSNFQRDQNGNAGAENSQFSSSNQGQETQIDEIQRTKTAVSEIVDKLANRVDRKEILIATDGLPKDIAGEKDIKKIIHYLLEDIIGLNPMTFDYEKISQKEELWIQFKEATRQYQEKIYLNHSEKKADGVIDSEEQTQRELVSDITEYLASGSKPEIKPLPAPTSSGATSSSEPKRLNLGADQSPGDNQ